MSTPWTTTHPPTASAAGDDGMVWWALFTTNQKDRRCVGVYRIPWWRVEHGEHWANGNGGEPGRP